MKLTYWVVDHKSDSHVYNIRAKTRRGALDQIANHWNESDFDKPYKVTVEYRDAFDLLIQCSNEGRMCWEADLKGFGIKINKQEE